MAFFSETYQTSTLISISQRNVKSTCMSHTSYWLRFYTTRIHTLACTTYELEGWNIPLGCCHHPHPLCCQGLQMGSFLDLMGLPAQSTPQSEDLLQIQNFVRNTWLWNKTHIKVFGTFKDQVIFEAIKQLHMFTDLQQTISCLNQKLIPPVVKIVKWFHNIDIIDKNTAICTTVEGNPKTLKSLLACCIPNLLRNKSVD